MRHVPINHYNPQNLTNSLSLLDFLFTQQKKETFLILNLNTSNNVTTVCYVVWCWRFKPDEYVHKHEHLPFCSSNNAKKCIKAKKKIFFSFPHKCVFQCVTCWLLHSQKKVFFSCLTQMRNQRNHKSILLLKNSTGKWH